MKSLASSVIRSASHSGTAAGYREADEMLRSYVSENYGEGVYEASHSVEGTSVPVYKLDRKSAFRLEDDRASTDWARRAYQ